MKTLIIPDIHNEVENASHWIETQKYDQVIYLGDFFDSFGDTVLDARKTAYWLKGELKHDNRIFLLSNHDAPYRFPKNDQLYCPGFTHEKSNRINEILTQEDWFRFKLFHNIDNWYFSHAGIHPKFIPYVGIEFFYRVCNEALENAKANIPDSLFSAGYARGGSDEHGGILWMDWSALVPMSGINQVVGHTPYRWIRELRTSESENYCLDVMNASVCGILEDGKFETKYRA